MTTATQITCEVPDDCRVSSLSLVTDDPAVLAGVAESHAHDGLRRYDDAVTWLAPDGFTVQLTFLPEEDST